MLPPLHSESGPVCSKTRGDEQLLLLGRTEVSVVSVLGGLALSVGDEAHATKPTAEIKRMNIFLIILFSPIPL